MILPKPIIPQAGQESVWDYPRPPKLQKVKKTIWILFGEILLVNTQNAFRVLETSHPPGYYIPQMDIKMEYLIPSSRNTFCEWKGKGSYYHIQAGNKRAENAAWFYNDPRPNFQIIKDFIAFYPALMDSCFIDDELVIPQPGEFYGGWITQDIVGPFKGMPGSGSW